MLTPAQRDYRKYLRTDHWRDIRDAALERANHQCHDCGALEQLQVHHLTYQRLWKELPEDLVVVCDSCHEDRHTVDTPIKIGDWERIRKEVPDYQDGVLYTQRQIELMTEKILLEGSEKLSIDSNPAILLEPHLKSRYRKELYTSAGVPDPSIVEGMYWRTHPQGRGFYTAAERKEKECGFYGGSLNRPREWQPEPTDYPRYDPEDYAAGPISPWKVVREAFRVYPLYLDYISQNGGYDIIDRKFEVNGDTVEISFSPWDLFSALKRRSVQQKRAIYYHVICDLKQREAASVMGITTVSVGQYVQAGCIMVAQELGMKEETHISGRPKDWKPNRTKVNLEALLYFQEATCG